MTEVPGLKTPRPWRGISLVHIEKTLASIVKINEDMSGSTQPLPHSPNWRRFLICNVWLFSYQRLLLPWHLAW